MQVITIFMRLFFYLLYHPFAWAYDLVAWSVSFGRWKDWIVQVVPFIEAKQVLELGHGPGHLQRLLHGRNLLPYGLDKSRQMGHHAKRRLIRNGYANINLTRGVAQFLPFRSNSFNTIVSTFPTEYFSDQRTLVEVRRVLINGGRFVVLPLAWITGKNFIDKSLAWIFKITGQAPLDPIESIVNKFKFLFQNAGFEVEIQKLKVKSSLLLIVIATKG